MKVAQFPTIMVLSYGNGRLVVMKSHCLGQKVYEEVQTKKIHGQQLQNKSAGCVFETQLRSLQFLFKFDSSRKRDKTTVTFRNSYDPVDWRSPVVFRFKVLLQKIWVQDIEWDQIIFKEVQDEWEEIKDDLPN